MVKHMVNTARLLVFLFASLAAASDLPAPIWVDNDRKNIPEPEERKLSEVKDFILGSVARPVVQVIDVSRHIRKLADNAGEAQNVNSLDEAPDSSWYTNRNFLHSMTEEELTRGA